MIPREIIILFMSVCLVLLCACAEKITFFTLQEPKLKQCACPEELEASPERKSIKGKNGKEYCVTKKGTWQNRWWNYYERALSCMDGNFWEEAEADLCEAIRQKRSDQRQASMYGYHYIDYFPNRELGIVLLKDGKGRIKEAIKKLEHSLSKVKTVRGSLYLNEARKILIKDYDKKSPELVKISMESVRNEPVEFLMETNIEEADIESPQKIRIESPKKNDDIKFPQRRILTSALSVIISGVAVDDNFVSSVKINDNEVPIDVSNPTIPFRMELPLISGKNEIPILISDLANNESEFPFTIFADHSGPIIGTDDPIITSEKNFRLRGYVSDKSGLSELSINGRKEKKLNIGARQFNFTDNPLDIKTEEKQVVIEAKDRFGNINSVKILLPDNIGKTDSNLVAENAILKRSILSDRSKPIQLSLSYNNIFLAQPFSSKEKQEVPIYITKLGDKKIKETKRGNMHNKRENACPNKIEMKGYVIDKSKLLKLTSIRINGDPEELIADVEKHYFDRELELNKKENPVTIEVIPGSGHAHDIEFRIDRNFGDPADIMALFSRDYVGKEDPKLSSDFPATLRKVILKDERFSVFYTGNFIKNVQQREDMLEKAKNRNIDYVWSIDLMDREKEVTASVDIVDPVSRHCIDSEIDFQNKDLWLLACEIYGWIARRLPRDERGTVSNVEKKQEGNDGKCGTVNVSFDKRTTDLKTGIRLTVNEEEYNKLDGTIGPCFNKIGKARVGEGKKMKGACKAKVIDCEREVQEGHRVTTP